MLRIVPWVILLATVSFSFTDTTVTHHKNDQLDFVRPDYAGNPKIGNRFQNQSPRDQPGFWKLMKWGFSHFGDQSIKTSDTFRPRYLSLTPDSIAKMRGVVWLGHSSLLIQSDSISLLIDPVQSFPFNKRLSPSPILLSKIPHVDYLLVSHGHLDHLDTKVASALDGSRTTALVPLKMGNIIRNANPNMVAQEAGWWQKFRTSKHVEVVFLPAQHWHRRGLADQDEVLWGGYWIRIDGVTIYYSGDTSYGPHFKEIRRIMGAPDIAILPIGAYRPDYIMKASHMTPLEASEAFRDLGAKVLLPCHWGTFDLSDEPPGEPIQWLRQIEAQGNISGKLVEMGIGEVIPFSVVGP